jgi:hypothetical protein
MDPSSSGDVAGRPREGSQDASGSGSPADENDWPCCAGQGAERFEGASLHPEGPADCFPRPAGRPRESCEGVARVGKRDQTLELRDLSGIGPPGSRRVDAAGADAISDGPMLAGARLERSWPC